ncbi:MAG: VCBS repeat-containing protein [Pyrinomonadaceae bacterium]
MYRSNRQHFFVRINRACNRISYLVLIFALTVSAVPVRKVSAQTKQPESTHATFSNTAPIIWADTGPNNGSVYPSPIVVSGLSGTVPAVLGSIKVNINNFSHGFPGDVGLVLVGPTGAALQLQNGAGFSPMSNVTYTISDAAYNRIGTGGSWMTGTYSPAYQAGGSYPAPGPLNNYNVPLPSGNATLTSTFAGTNPNGTWKLYTRDFVTGIGGSIAGGWTLEINTALTPNNAVLDFDGDGKTDFSLTRNVSGNLYWYFIGPNGYNSANWGLPSDTVVPGDYDGDGKWDVAIFRNGTFHILKTSNATFYSTTQFGQSGDDPRITQDYDGDGKADPAVVRPVGANLVFYILRSSLGFTAVQFGLSAIDVGIRGDFDGDGKADIAVYRTTGSPANTFFVLPSGGGPLMAANFGDFNTDYVIPADFDGDHKTDFTVWRGIGPGSNAAWYWLQSSNGAFKAATFGIGNLDRPAPGDYDGDGKTDIAVWRPGLDGAFYYSSSASGSLASRYFGTTTDLPPAFTLQTR